jgi:hypothetical protein
MTDSFVRLEAGVVEGVFSSTYKGSFSVTVFFDIQNVPKRPMVL